MAAPQAAERPHLEVVGGDESTLERLAGAALTQPDLAGLVPFWTGICRVQLAGRAALGPPPLWTVRRDRLQAGKPQLELADLPLAPEALGQLAGRLAQVWSEHDPTRAQDGEADWLALAHQAFSDPTLWHGQRRELAFAESVAALALAPYLEWAAAGIVPALEGEWTAWGRGTCPVCGGLPDLAVLVGDPAARSLVCGRCSTGWPHGRVGCPFCGDVERQAYHPSDDGRYRLYLCPACRRYLKTVDANRLGGVVDPRVERLVTIGMDLAALEAGYGPQ